MLQLLKHRTLDVFRCIGKHRVLHLGGQQPLCQSYSQCQFTSTLWAAQHHSMRQAVFVDHLQQALLHLLLSDYLFKHSSRIYTIRLQSYEKVTKNERRT